MSENNNAISYSIEELKELGITANSNLSKDEFKNTKNIILNLHKQSQEQIKNGYGPFLAAIYDDKNNLIAQKPNSVIKEKNALHHAEINTINQAYKVFKNYDLSSYDLSIYITAEPCIMCLGAIMWSGINKIFYSVPSKNVETITGFDEGFKPNWIEEFQKKNIKVYGNIETKLGEKVLEEYTNTQEIYKPNRK